MGNACRKTEIEVGEIKVGAGPLAAETKGCRSRCCMSATEEEEKQHEQHDRENERKAAQLLDVQMALRFGSNLADGELLRAIRKLVQETGEVPDVVVLGPGMKSPPILKRTLTVRIEDRSPKEGSIAHLFPVKPVEEKKE